MRSQCTTADDSRWIAYTEEKCTTIRSVEPWQVQMSELKELLQLDVDNLPVIANAAYACVFTFNNTTRLTMPAVKPPTSTKLVTCTTPASSKLPAIGRGEHALSATLSVLADANARTEFASTNFTFYDCATYTTCTQCAQSAYPCDWCIESGVCTTATEDVCRGMHVVNGDARKGASDRRGGQYCPQILPTAAATTAAQAALDTSIIYVAAGTTKAIAVSAVNLLDVHRDFECWFTIETSVFKKKAVKQADK